MVRKFLGPVRAWDGALEEMRRNESANYLGLRLEPYGRMQRQGYPRPVYLLRDVLAFICRARELATPPSKPAEIDAFEIEIDPTLHCPWRVRTVVATPR